MYFAIWKICGILVHKGKGADRTKTNNSKEIDNGTDIVVVKSTSNGTKTIQSVKEDEKKGRMERIPRRRLRRKKRMRK